MKNNNEENLVKVTKEQLIQNSKELNLEFRICPTCSMKSLKTENGCDVCVECGYSKCDK